jgi:tetratricopeptide (TPR) repeat protein
MGFESTKDKKQPLRVWLKFLPFVAIMAMLPACSTTSTPKSNEIPSGPVKGPESDYQWAMQSYESGRYAEALKRFNQVKDDEGIAFAHGAELLYSRARCLYQLEKWNEAESEFLRFIERYSDSPSARDARMYLLLIYNQQRNWPKSTSLAAEASARESFSGNRILIKLLWTEALAEQREIVGARSALAEAKEMLAAIPDGSLMGEVYGESRDSLADRAKWLEAHVEIRNCSTITPPNPEKGRPGLKAAEAWMSRLGQCWREATDQAMKVLPEINPRWRRALALSLENGFESLAESPAQLSKAARFTREQASELTRPELRKTLYAIQSRLEQAASLKNGGAAAEQSHESGRIIRDLMQKLDGVLQKLSIEAVKTDRQF